MEEGKEQGPPVIPVSTGATASEPSAAGVHVEVDESWHVSRMPEEKQYFALDVSTIDSNTSFMFQQVTLALIV